LILEKMIFKSPITEVEMNGELLQSILNVGVLKDTEEIQQYFGSDSILLRNLSQDVYFLIFSHCLMEVLSSPSKN
jgi:hypothetical protein